MEIRYRADIDGLRAVAIVPVVLFHAGVPFLNGGFVGVDVFFVISGFLITGIIAREVDERRFSILTFYERRVRRIVPALFARTLAVLAAAWWLYFPDDFAAVAQSVIAALLFVSNVNFWHEASYFGPTALTQPMLHTWSLAVEEQFYILFPPLLVLIARWRPHWRVPVLWALFAGSLAFCLWQTARYPSAAFYLPMARTWELATGALLAVSAVPQLRARGPREAVAAAGLLPIVLAILTVAERGFPGWQALLPVLGSAALLHIAPGTVTGRLLGARPLVAIGLISYSLYLWHWPLIVFPRYAADGAFPPAFQIAALAGSVLFAWASWRFVERPFRSRDRVPRTPLFAWAGAGAAALALASGAVFASGGVPSRIRPDALRLARQVDDVSPVRLRCHVDGTADLRRPPCPIGAAVPPATLVWGDSHAVELAYALGEVARPHRAAVLQGTGSSCPPVPTLTVGRLCDAHNRAMRQWVATHPAIRTVVLAGFWTDAGNRNRRGLPDALVSLAYDFRAGGRQVIFVRDAPPQAADVPRRLAHLAGRGELARQAGTTRAQADALEAYLAPALARMRADGVTIVDAKDALCRGSRCDTYRDGRALYFDRHHLSLSGARLVAARMAPVLDDPANNEVMQ